MKKIVLVIVLLVGAYAIGFYPERMKARRAGEQSSRLELQLGLARLQGKLGMVCYEANRGNFANAATLSTDFFDATRTALLNPLVAGDAKRKAELEAMAARRDELTADLARLDPAVKDKLADMYVELSRVVAGP